MSVFKKNLKTSLSIPDSYTQVKDWNELDNLKDGDNLIICRVYSNRVKQLISSCFRSDRLLNKENPSKCNYFEFKTGMLYQDSCEEHTSQSHIDTRVFINKIGFKCGHWVIFHNPI